MVRKPQRKHSIIDGISWAPCKEIVWGLLQLGPRSPCSLSCLRGIFSFSSISATQPPPPPQFVDVSSCLCGRRFRLKPEEQNSRLGKEESNSKSIHPRRQPLGGGGGGGEVVNKWNEVSVKHALYKTQPVLTAKAVLKISCSLSLPALRYMDVCEMVEFRREFAAA